MSKPLIVTAQCTALPEDTARLLRKLADQIETGNYTSITNCGMRAIVREGEAYEEGENPIAGRFHAVVSEDGVAADPLALFREKQDADKWARGLDIVTRADIVGSVWSAVAPDPHPHG